MFGPGALGEIQTPDPQIQSLMLPAGGRTSSISALLALVAWLVIADLIYWVVTRIIALRPLPVARSASPCPPSETKPIIFCAS
jgi:hypothetical protein